VVTLAAATSELSRSAREGLQVSFSTDMAKLVADQLSRFVTLNTHQLAGQTTNLDFWLAQVRHALAVIDGYGVRFVRMEAGQQQYVAANDTILSEVGPAGDEERRPPPPRRIPDRELQKARRALVEAAARFLERCRRDGLISEQQLTASRGGLGIE
jgi:hypothetical protein